MQSDNQGPSKSEVAAVVQTVTAPKLESGTSPLDFIERNLAKAGAAFVDQKTKSSPAASLLSPEVPQKPIQPQVNQEVKPSQIVAPPGTPDTSIQYEIDPQPPTPDKGKEAPKQEGVDTGVSADTDTSDTEFDTENQVPAAENFKKLRTKYKETAKTLATLQEEKRIAEEKLLKYETGEIVPEILQEKENRIKELSHYEKLHNLKFSPEYQENFIEPIKETETKLLSIAEEYNIPPQAISDALSLSNKDLNNFLSNHFDDVAAIETKQLINQLRDLKNSAAEAEKKPLEALEALQAEHTKVLQVKDIERKNKIADNSRNAWTKALLDIRGEGKAKELIMDSNNPEFNEKVVKPLVTAAAQEYGKLVTLLAESGLKNLNEEAAYALARMTQLAHASAVSIASREAALEHADELERNTAKIAGYTRPSIGGGGGGNGASSGPPTPRTPQEAGRQLAHSLLSGPK